MSILSRFSLRILVSMAILAASLPWAQVAPQADNLAAGFKDPPRQYGIRCWWWWLNGNVTREAITHDLEAMKDKGFSGACIVDAGGADQRGNSQVPEGPMFGSPAWRVLFRHALNEAARLNLTLSLNIQSGWNLGGPDILPEEAAKHLTWSKTSTRGPGPVKLILPDPPARDGFYRDIAVFALPAKPAANRPPIRNLEDKAAFKEVSGSVADTRHLLTDVPGQPGEEDALLTAVIPLSQKVEPGGVVHWQAPAGDWAILRMGYTTSPAHVSTSSGKWQGRVLDYLSERHFMRYWLDHVEPLLEDAEAFAGPTLRYLQTDSWELGGLNWTEGMEAEFKSRRGYDLLPFLPVIAGYIIENREVSNRFLADWRKTISDLIAEKHYAVFAREARQHNLGIQPESAGPHLGPFDGLKNYQYSELMMSEFWIPSPHRPTPERRFFVKQAASAAHIYNRTLVGAEAFTSIGPHWDDVPWAAHKPSFDHEICAGLNLAFVHTFTCSPPEMGKPGQEYFAGTHFNPNLTWWDLSGEFIRYLSRVQYLSQRGTVVADALYYVGDHIPIVSGLKEADPARVMPGYDYDLINEDVLLRSLEVRDGRLTLPHGIGYRILVLPDHRVLSLAVLKKVRQLIQDGATVLGARPLRTISLTGYPACDGEFTKLAGEAWGPEVDKPGEHRFGKGRAVWGYTGKEFFSREGLPEDCEFPGSAKPGSWDFIHRRLGDAEYYFVSNQSPEMQRARIAFRVNAKQPELWEPVTGQSRDASSFTQTQGRTFVPLEFQPYESMFVVFRKPIPITASGSGKTNGTLFAPLLEITGPWTVQFDTRWGGPDVVQFGRLESWTTRTEPGIRFYSGKALYSCGFDLPYGRGDGEKLFLELGDVKDVGMARIKLNGKEMGITWTPPFRMEITDAVRASHNSLQVEIANSWRNRLVGDRELPEGKRLTRTNITIQKEWKLLESGLMGPVRILSAR
jgi:hypothetical protein